MNYNVPEWMTITAGIVLWVGFIAAFALTAWLLVTRQYLKGDDD